MENKCTNLHNFLEPGITQKSRAVKQDADIYVCHFCCLQLNLASQSVLEGLNACFDHRAEVFVPELAMSFKVKHELTRFFACQNPVCEGGGRKNLPRSFLNRFTQVYMDALTASDLLFITKSSYPQIPSELLECMVEFNQQVVFVKYLVVEVVSSSSSSKVFKCIYR